MTKEQKVARRKVLVKRNAARKIKATWARKKQRPHDTGAPADDFGGVPDTDAALDELPDSLFG